MSHKERVRRLEVKMGSPKDDGMVRVIHMGGLEDTEGGVSVMTPENYERFKLEHAEDLFLSWGPKSR